ncbi:hypothetical protein NBO_820g0002 [Nosema bombycis CQ1]|uniref:Uncharacterized protein n=1 Tax=Nosema bombycis (strain CQ1 / CVCC 102059) TaxID=578461 RepID=R0MCN0_NOSB1|nr:hypothetical protein NBO_820g0002 [Nosema bombycis CQ1]|eukprot:EOB11795.1 hypothetical protein NBO_820g0002 [Nosema bombycis CQ1]
MHFFKKQTLCIKKNFKFLFIEFNLFSISSLPFTYKNPTYQSQTEQCYNNQDNDFLFLIVYAFLYNNFIRIISFLKN